MRVLSAPGGRAFWACLAGALLWTQAHPARAAAGAGEGAPDRAIVFYIPPSGLDAALEAFAEQTGAEIIYADRDIAGKTSPGVAGILGETQALDILIAGTGLEFVKNEYGVIIVRRVSEPAQDRAAAPAADTSPEAGMREIDERSPVDEVVAIGTNIRGVRNPASPVHIHRRETIERSGAASVQDFVRLLPQNLNFSDTTAAGFAGPPSGFGGAGAAIDMRGLGEGATLTLVNGRRVAPGGEGAGFVDISLLPLSAIERIEMVTDGASAIYGADAVAGVANFELVDRIEGAQTDLAFGSVTEGGLRQLRASQMAGTKWSGGNIFAGYEFLGSTRLDSQDRKISAGAADPTDLSPKRERHSVFAGASAALSPDLDVEIFGLYSDREVSFRLSDNLFGAGEETTSARLLFGNVSGTYHLGRGWAASFSANYSRNETAGARLAASAPPFDVDARSAMTVAELMAEGPVFAAPGGDVRLAAGFQFRSERFLRSTMSVTQERTSRDRRAYAGFAELYVPVFGEPNARSGLEELTLTAAARIERFSDFGETVNPKVGLRYAPSEEIRFRGTFGTSFQAPGLYDLGRNRTVQPLPGALFVPDPDALGAPPDVLVLSGGNPDLDPENATTWTAGADFGSFGAPGFAAALTYYDIKFKNRIGTPGVALNQALATPEAFGGAVTIDPALEQVQPYYVSSEFSNPFGISADAIGAIVDYGLANTASTKVSGVDLKLGYEADIGAGALSAGLDASYMFDYNFQANSAQDRVSLLDTVFHPPDLRFRANAGFGSGAFSAAFYVNYVDSYESFETGVREQVASWTTVDLGLTYDGGDAASSQRRKGLSVNLYVANLFDEPPPFVDLGLGLGLSFDGVNANATGRFISIGVSKSW
ncbi:TonB-dependent receptor [Hyphococcus luteus]|uniref:Secretin/TonB short N-terminal domain-containing protein n=1 Tax=Hyphococcus luteus TaxID=2058213 RepID=A0A2S7K3W7_9PROT|nr:TonB-dependent receptor [Marinicaulis flavus]PQA87176.1 hypothetical protein CW354_14145 [Marinicaulis flavus]